VAVDLEFGIDTNVTPSLHPQVVASLEDYDDDTSGHLQQVVEAFQQAYEQLGKLHLTKDAAFSDPTMTEAAAVVRTADHAEKVFKIAATRFDKVTANLTSGIANMEKDLNTPVQAHASHHIASEIRAHIKGQKSPMDFVRNAIERGDKDTVSAALGAPPYLTGLTPEMQAGLLRMWNEKTNPLAAKRMRAMKAGLDLIGSNAPLLHGEVRRAVGVPQHKIKAFREAKQRADKAFAS